MIEKFLKQIKNKNFNYVIFDVGSRDCLQSIEFYHAFPNAKIYAFECNPNTIEICKKNIEPYKNRITLIEGAVCDYDGNITFYPINQKKTITSWKDGNPGASSIFKSNGKYKIEKYVQDKIITKCHRLDSIIKKYKITRVDIMWMDLQGAELLALKGLGNYINNLEHLHTKARYKEIYSGQVMYNELNNYISSKNFEIVNNLSKKNWQEDVIYQKKLIKYIPKNINSSKKNIFIHVIGIEGSGHSFWIKLFNKLINEQDRYKKGFHNQSNNLTASDVTRKYLQNKSWGWNIYDKKQNVKSIKELDNNYRKYINDCKDWIIFHGDSYPNSNFRKTDQNINMIDFYNQYKSDFEFKFIFINRDIFPCINSCKSYDSNIGKHAKNMIEHTEWIRNMKRKLPENSYIDVHYRNIDIEKLSKFLPFGNIKPIFDKLYKQSNEKISSSDLKIMNCVFNDNSIFDIIIPVGPNDVNIIEKQIKYTRKNVIGYRNIYLISYDPNLIVEGCKTINENIFPFTKKTVFKIHGDTRRNGWYLQQLLKFYAGNIIPNILKRYLVIDSDTFFLKPTKFILDDKCLYNFSTESNQPYFDHMRRLHKMFTKVDSKKSGICHHMIFENKYVNEIINIVEKEHKDKFYNIFLKKVTFNDRHSNGASEYELYFNYMLKNHKNKIKIRKLNWKDVEVFKGDANFDYVSYHWHSRKE